MTAAEAIGGEEARSEPLATFTDPARQREYETDGFTVIPLLAPDEVQHLLDRYAELVPEPDTDIITFDFTRDDRQVMGEVADLLRPLFARKVPEHFVDHEAVFWTFVIKPPGPHGELALHDDRTYIDESRGRACTVWVPLVDTGPEVGNGHLCVVAGSHTIMPVASGTTIPNWFGPYEQYLRDHSLHMTVPAGSALIYDSKTLHWSPPNLTDQTRPAIAVAVVPAGEQVVHVVGEGMHLRRVYAVDEQFYVDFHPTAIEQGMPDRYPLLREYREERVEATPEDIAAAIGADDLPVPTGPVEAPVPREYRPGADDDDEGDPELAPDPVGGTTESGASSLHGGIRRRRRWWRR